jgi:hypothetical protein
MLSAVASSWSKRRVARPTAVPHSAPATTSLGQCALVRSREWATAIATGVTTSPAAGLSHAIAVVNAAAVAAWDEGNDEDVGLRTNAWYAGK